jgi:hypothetical protein
VCNLWMKGSRGFAVPFKSGSGMTEAGTGGVCDLDLVWNTLGLSQPGPCQTPEGKRAEMEDLNQRPFTVYPRGWP